MTRIKRENHDREAAFTRQTALGANFVLAKKKKKKEQNKMGTIWAQPLHINNLKRRSTAAKN